MKHDHMDYFVKGLVAIFIIAAVTLLMFALVTIFGWWLLLVIPFIATCYCIGRAITDKDEEA